MSFLKGKKTYICFAIVFLAGGLHAIGIIDAKTLETVVTVFGSLGGISLRSSMK